MKCSEASIGGRGLRSDDALHKSTECLANISPDSTLAPGSLDRASSQPNLLALDPEDLVLSSKHHRSKSPVTHSAPKSADDSRQASNDTVMFTFSRPPPEVSSRPAKDGVDRQRVRNEDVAVLDKTLAKVMSSLKSIDAIEQNTDVPENVGRTKSSKDEDGQKSSTGASMTVPITVKTSSARDDQHDVSSLASFSRGKKKSSTLPKSGSVEAVPDADADSMIRHAESSHLGPTSSEGQHASPRSSLIRSDSAPQRKEPSTYAAFQSRYEASSRAIPAATPVVPSGLPPVHSGPPSVPPKPSTAKKPVIHGLSLIHI